MSGKASISDVIRSGSASTIPVIIEVTPSRITGSSSVTVVTMVSITEGKAEINELIISGRLSTID